MRVGLWTSLSVVAVPGISIAVAACGGGNGGGGGGGGRTINVAIVDNPQMKDIASLTPSLFTAKSGVKVNYTVLDEGTLRQVTTRDVAAGGRQLDVVMLGPYEAPQFGNDGTIEDLTPRATADASSRLGDVIPSVRNALWRVPHAVPRRQGRHVVRRDRRRRLARSAQPGKPLYGIEAGNSGRLIVFAGGIPLISEGRVVGAIGASGGSVEQDQEVAEAGVAAF